MLTDLDEVQGGTAVAHIFECVCSNRAMDQLGRAKLPLSRCLSQRFEALTAQQELRRPI